MKVSVDAILFKELTDINWRALSGEQRGQYDLRVGTNAEFENFFQSIPVENPTDRGGWDRDVTFQPFDGPKPVPEHHVTFHFMGPTSARKDFYFASQRFDRPESYPLWHPSRVAKPGAGFAEIKGAAVLVIRDTNNQFHARWVSARNLSKLLRM